MTTTWIKAKNRAASTLATSVTDAGTSWVVATGEGGNFPSTFPFHITCENEIVTCTTRSGDTLTVTRAAESTTAATHGSGSAVQLRVTAQMLTELQEGKTRAATWVIAPSTASDYVKNGADEVLTGTASSSTDASVINAALTLYKNVLILEGTVYLEAEISLTDTKRNTLLGVGTEATAFQAITDDINMIHVSGGANDIEFGDFQLNGNSLAAKGIYFENGTRATLRSIYAVNCKTWGMDFKYNHSLFATKLICNSNGAGANTGGLHLGVAGTPFNVFVCGLLIAEDNTGDGVWIEEANTVDIAVLAENNTRNGVRIYNGTATRSSNILIRTMHAEGNNTSAAGTGIADLLVEDGLDVSLLSGLFNDANVTKNILVNATGSGSRYFFLGNVSMNNGATINSDEFSTTFTASTGSIAIGTGVREIKTGGHFFESVELDLSGAAVDNNSLIMRRAGSLVSAVVWYTEASSADAGVAIRIGRIQDGVALDDDYFLSKTSEVSKALGYMKFYFGADFTQQSFASGDTITIGTAGGKTGTGAVKVKLQYFQSN